MTAADNPFLTESSLPFRLPDYARITDEHYGPAFEAGMAEQLAEVEAIVTDPGPVTFENTIAALERSGQVLARVSTVFFSRATAHTNPAIEALQAEVAPVLAAHRDAVALDPRLFARIRDLHERRDTLDLDPESRRLLERHHDDAVRAGALLGEADQQRLRELNAELSTLSTAFGSRLLADTNASAVTVDDPARLDGLTAGAVSAAAAAATARGRQGHLLTLVLPTAQPALVSLTDRALREELFTASVSRGSRGNSHDTRELVRRLATLRAERARLLGFRDHASYVIADNTAGTVDAVSGLLAGLAPAAVENARAEAADLQAAIGDGHELAPWDWAFYAERVRRERYAVDGAALRPYLEFERVLRDGVFHAAGLLYGLRFVERHDLAMYHEDVRMWEVFRDDGTPVGLYGGDFYARESKRGGAWMNALVDQSQLLGHRPVVMNTLNIGRPADGEPTLLTFDEVTTLFHEFGHALHGLLSDVRFPTFSGTSVPRDFVEFPSQVNEMWSLWPEVLANYARHHETGEALPADVVERLRAGQVYGEGFATTEYLAAALLDQAWHTLTVDDDAERVEDVERFETEALAAAGVALAAVPPRYRSAYFNHVFAGGYSAGYYSYIWSEVLDADTVEWFTENGGLRRENGEVFRRELLSRGGSVDPMEAFRAFRGRDPEIAPLLARRGLTRSS